MLNKFEEAAPSLSDSDLQKYIDNWKLYVPEAVEAAMAEAAKRERPLSEEEKEKIRTGLRDRSRLALGEDEKASASWMWGNWKKNVVRDPNAPELYSERAIYNFAFFFGVLFGSILLAMNMRRTESRNQLGVIILFGILFTCFQVGLGVSAPKLNGLSPILSIAAASILRLYFWPKYIGKDTKYRKRTVWVPLTIGLGIFGVFFFFAFVVASHL